MTYFFRYSSKYIIADLPDNMEFTDGDSLKAVEH